MTPTLWHLETDALIASALHLQPTPSTVRAATVHAHDAHHTQQHIPPRLYSSLSLLALGTHRKKFKSAGISERMFDE